ncbi:MAG: 3-phosphoshikimate 1-carboxyvinyltransferase [Lawsonibacter sp.]
MSNIRIHPEQLEGTVTPPSSKSMTHRLIVCAALAQGSSTIENVDISQDILATLNCVERMGAEWVRVDAHTVQVNGIGGQTTLGGRPHLDCGESGSTLRFLIPVALAAAGEGTFTGRGRLMERPLQPYFDLFQEKGIHYELQDGVLTVRGKLEPGEYRLPGNVSSQFLTGLLLALPLLPGESRIVLTTPLESRDYVSMTLEVMGDFGIAVRKEGECLLVEGGQTYGAQSKMVETDWSQAAFWYAANFLGSQIDIRDLNSDSSQGDMRVADYYWKLAKPGEVELDVSQCPDLVPPLAVMAALRSGTCRLVNAARLRLKESDRLAAVTEVLNALGARVEEGADHLTIHGVDRLEGGVAVDCRNDHRIAMMAAAAATRCKKPVGLLGAECVNKSYPGFWEHYRTLGGKIDVVIPG